LSKAHRIIEESLKSAEINGEIHHRMISRDFTENLEAIHKLLDKIAVLLKRCPIDLALMKRIPLHPKFSEQREPKLIDLDGQRWQDQYIECAAERDNIVKLLEESEEFIKQIKPSDGILSPLNRLALANRINPEPTGHNIDPILNSMLIQSVLTSRNIRGADRHSG
jgi:hypothetical protein